MFGLEEYMQAD